MSKIQIRIGTDNTIEGGNEIVIVAQSGEVSIQCPASDGWAGYKVLAQDLDDVEAETLARRIAANPIEELEALGYECDWLDET